MTRVWYQQLRRHAGRLLLASLSIVLGTGFLTGALVLSDTLEATFTQVAEATTPQAVEIRTRTDPRNPATTIDARLLEEIEETPGAERAEGNVEGLAAILDQTGEVVTLAAGAPPLALTYIEGGVLTLLDGRAPQGEWEIAVEEATLEAAGAEIGGTALILTPQGPREVTVTGVLQYGNGAGATGPTVIAFDLTGAQATFGEPGQLTTIQVQPTRGTSHDTLKERLQEELGSSYQIRTPAEVAAEQEAGLGNALRFFETLLLVFAGTGLLVGGYLIANTFQILVAQRTEELALLRLVGASRWQVSSAVLAEGGALGAAGTLIGLPVGTLLAGAAQKGAARLGGDLPTVDLVTRSESLVAAGTIGFAVTVLAVTQPAIRAGRNAPLGVLTTTRSHRAGHSIRAALTLLLATTGGTLLGSENLREAAAGAALILLATAAGLPLAVHTLGRIPLPGLATRLGKENLVRNARRTGATAGALVVGVAVVTTVGVLTASVQASTTDLVRNQIGAELVIAPSGIQLGLPPSLVDDLRNAGIEAGSLQRGPVTIGESQPLQMTAADPEVLDIIDLEADRGRARIEPGEVLLATETAESLQLQLGETVTITFPDESSISAEVTGTYTSTALGDLVLHTQMVTNARGDDAILIGEGERGTVEQVVANHPGARVLDQEEFIAEVETQLDRLLSIVVALLGLSILVAVLGVANTLGLSVLERSRELGLLRALGATKQTVRNILVAEAVLTSVLGAGAGIVAGSLLGHVLVSRLADDGITTRGYPTSVVAATVVFAAAAGLVSAALPALRAGKVSPVIAAKE